LRDQIEQSGVALHTTMSGEPGLELPSAESLPTLILSGGLQGIGRRRPGLSSLFEVFRRGNPHLPLPLSGKLAYHQVMNKIYGSYNMFLGATLGLAILVTGAYAGAQNKGIKEVPAQMTSSLDSQELYVHYCAVCHGVDGKGAGPAAGALKKQPGDLTLLSRRNGGKFPALAVQMSIKGSNGIVAHGTREMPMWGSIFSEMGQNRTMGDLRVMALLKYIEQIQAK
jgi:mono/diheme cytochrome c family protein